MAFFQPAPVPVLGRAVMKTLARQLPRTSSSPLAYSSRSSSTSAATTISSQPSCRRCLRAPKASSPWLSVLSSVARSRQTARQFRNPFAPFARCLSNSTAKKTTAPSPSFDSKFNTDANASSANSDSEIKSSKKTKSRSWPETTSTSVAYWLLGSAASVFGIVVFGGLTRLTESG